MVVFALPAIGYLVLQNDHIQTKLVQKIATKVSDKLNAKFTFDRVNISFFNRIVFDNVYIEDQSGDTLLFAKELSGSAYRLNFSKRKINLNRITLNDPYIRLSNDSTGIINLKFIIDAIDQNKDTTREKMQLTANSITLNNARFHLDLYENKVVQDSGIIFSDLRLHDLNINLRKFRIEDEAVVFLISSMGFEEQSGFTVKNLNTRMSIHGDHMRYDDISIHTPHSKIMANHLYFNFDSFQDFGDNGFSSKVFLDFEFIPSSINFYDLGFFAKPFYGRNTLLNLAGDIKGTIDNLKGSDIVLDYNRDTKFSGNFSLNGLPKIEETFIFLEINEFLSSINDIENLELEEFGISPITFPENFKKLGILKYTGKFTGFIDDFVAYGKLESSIGSISTDLLIKPDTSNYLKFRGSIASTDFLIGELTDTNGQLGNISFSAKVNGFSHPKENLNADIDGVISKLEFRNYNYKNISLHGAISNETFDGSLEIEDQNISMSFLGRVDFSSEEPEFDFTANVPYMNLTNLNLVEDQDSTLSLSFLLTANFIGDNIDNLNGDIRLLNSVINKGDKELILYDFILFADNNPALSTLAIFSDFIDAEISGQYKFNQLIESARVFSTYYLPSYKAESKNNISDNQNFSFYINLKRTDDIFDFFIPTLKIAENTYIHGDYNLHNHVFNVTGETSILSYAGNTAHNFFLNTVSSDSIFSIHAGTSSFNIKNQMELENFSVYLDALSDSIFLTMRSLNWDTVVSKGAIHAYASFDKSPESKKPKANIFLEPSEIIIRDTIWNISAANILVDSSYIMIDDFTIQHKDQYFRVNGALANNKVDQLNIELNNLDLSNLNFITQDKGIFLAGNIIGIASLSNVYSEPVFQANLTIEELGINDEVVGLTHLFTSWNHEQNSIQINSTSNRGTLETLKISGDYVPSRREIDFDITMEKLRMNIFRPYIDGVADNLNGIASGALNLSGPFSKLKLNGDVNLQKTSFTIDYLKTNYNFTSNIHIENNIALLNQIDLYDVHGNKAVVNGQVQMRDLKELHIDIRMNARNFSFLNTNSYDNNMFYGRAFATGIIHISGYPKNININVSARTERNTQFFIPLNSSEEIGEYNFITFVSYNEDADDQPTISQRTESNLTGLQLDFELDVTPDAEVQLIFDPKVGDIMKGRGYGNLKMTLNQGGKFNIFGDYRIEEGDYLFTLQNVINKRFKVEKGGVIQWNGDPIDANIDIKAVYNTKASLHDLDAFDGADTRQMESYKQRIPVECQILMTNKLMNPDIQFNIHLPMAEESTRDRLRKTLLNTQEEMSKQFLSLVVLNSFFMPESGTGQSSFGGSNVGAITTSELLSNQLSNWLSQISNEFDIGVNYRPGDELTSDEVELALSTQLLNDRVSINGNLDMGGTQTATTQNTNTNNIVGDFIVDVKLTRSGKLRVKAFNRANNQFYYIDSPYTQGVGLFYKEDFNSFNELVKRYWQKLTGKLEEETPKPVDEQVNHTPTSNHNF